MSAGAARLMPLIGVLVAIAITTTMDAMGYLNFSALPLFPLMALLWYLQRHSRQAMGFVWGHARDYALAALYPLLVLGATAAIAAAAGVIDTAQADWSKAWANFALVSAATVVMAIITEEGFFRGWLFASLERAGLSAGWLVVASSIAFSLWHLSAVTLDTGFDVPAKQVPVFMVNAALLGVTWGLMRLISGSVIVSSVSHGLWNGGAYVFFGYGTKTGALGIANTSIYGPEVGYVGLVLNLAFAVGLWMWWELRASRMLPDRPDHGA